MLNAKARLFLDEAEIAILTGRKRKTQQCEQLRQMGIAFFVNASGHPVVTRTAIEGGKQEAIEMGWRPAALRSTA